MPRLTVVSITFRDPRGLEQTLRSLESQLAGPVVPRDQVIEFVVVDGEGSPEVASVCSNSSIPVRLVAEPDDGIYDAMKKGAELATGEYVWFLNGGDEAAPGALEAVLTASNGRVDVLLFGYLYSSRAATRRRRPRSSLYLWHGLPTSHQAIIYRREPLMAVLRDNDFLSYRMSGDYAMTASLRKAGAAFQRSSAVIATFHAGGISTTSVSQVARDAARVQRQILRSPFPMRIASAALHRLSAARVRARARKASLSGGPLESGGDSRE